MKALNPSTITQANLKEHLSGGDTPERRFEFVHCAFEKYLQIVNGACRKYDPNHLNLGMRFGGQPPAYLLKMAKVFDVCSLNPYEYSPFEHLERAYQLIDRPII